MELFSKQARVCFTYSRREMFSCGLVDVLQQRSRCGRRFGTGGRRALPRGHRLTGRSKLPQAFVFVHVFVGAGRLLGAGGLRHDQHLLLLQGCC